MPTPAPVLAQAAAPAGDGGDDAADTPATNQLPPQAKAQVSAAAPAHLEQAGLPPQAAAAVGATAPASQQLIALLMRISAMPGLSEAQSSVVGKLLSNESLTAIGASLGATSSHSLVGSGIGAIAGRSAEGLGSAYQAGQARQLFAGQVPVTIGERLRQVGRPVVTTGQRRMAPIARQYLPNLSRDDQ